MVVSSDQQVAAIVNILGNSGQRADSYSSFTQGATTMNLPLIMKNNYGISTWFSVQNTGSAAANVTVAYKPGACTENASVPPYASKIFDQSANACLPAGYVGAATVTGVQPVAVTVMQVGSQNLLAYTGFGSTSTNPHATGFQRLLQIGHRYPDPKRWRVQYQCHYFVHAQCWFPGFTVY
jgi:hypothetical protein